MGFRASKMLEKLFFRQMQNTSPFVTYNTQYKELRSTHLWNFNSAVFILMEHDLYNNQKLLKETEIDIYRELVQLVQAVTVFVSVRHWHNCMQIIVRPQRINSHKLWNSWIDSITTSMTWWLRKPTRIKRLSSLKCYKGRFFCLFIYLL